MLEKFLPQNWRANPRNERTFDHSHTVARAAKVIAAQTSVLDPELAYLYGLMHDVGKFHLPPRESYKHPRVGYELLKSPHSDIAAICISHPFPDFDARHHILQYCKNDEVEAAEVQKILQTVEENTYVELIQFCDKVSTIDGYISIEEKLKWYNETYGISLQELNAEYIKPLLHIKKKLEKLTNRDVYELLLK
ncbi:MAG: HDOD domain-containing protein [Alphaproteobacteria bacterium]|nr:HDOD domain-containing protein [Alphaproteobacteria bacterium]